MISEFNYQCLNELVTTPSIYETIDGVSVYDSDMLRYIFRHYVGMSFLALHNSNPQNELKEMLIEYNKLYFNDYKKMYNALLLEYDPLENTNRLTEYTHGAQHDTNTLNSGAKHNTTTTTVKPYAFDSSNYSNGETVDGSTDINQFIDTNDIVRAGYTDVEKMSGNVGIRSSQELIDQEYKLRMFNLNYWYFDRFCKQTFFYC